MPEPFLMAVEDVFPRKPGRQVLATGCVERGRVRPGDEVQLVGAGGGATVAVVAVEVGRVPVREAGAGTNVAVQLPASVSGSVARGQVLAAPGSVRSCTGFTADLTPMPEEHGGAEIRTGTVLRFHVLTAVVLGTVTLPEGTDVLHPVHQGTVTIALESPVALEPGRRFAYRHHGRAAGQGTVGRLLP
ncbi:hypothetical protein [Kitasatospora sp. NPDC094015]|uniref:EF-Tu C-terminal domain-related protein n=1 Tax=Kitasatospora sp. NPDC094015 TaxID=3155205 RepID=UPI00332806C7